MDTSFKYDLLSPGAWSAPDGELFLRKRYNHSQDITSDHRQESGSDFFCFPEQAFKTLKARSPP